MSAKPEPLNLGLEQSQVTRQDHLVLERRDGIDLLYISGNVLILANDLGALSPDFLDVYKKWFKVFLQVKMGLITKACDFIGAMQFSNEQIFKLFNQGVFHGEYSFNVRFS